MKTKLGDFTPETVQAAFEKTELTPNSNTYYEPVADCGCALGAFVEVNRPGIMGQNYVNTGQAYWRTIIEELGITIEEEEDISAGFAGNRNHVPEDIDLYNLGVDCRKAVGLPCYD